MAGRGLRLEAAQARVDERGKRELVQLERDCAGVDAGELEEVVDEEPERPHLLPHRREVALGLGQAVLERLEHRLHRGERRPEVVARPGDELAPGVEESLDVGRHLVERGRQIGELGGPALGRPRREIAAGERRGRRAARARSTAGSSRRGGTRR